ncbi:heavy metal translocating P-type ATPase [Ilumatobacter nonamiensis]|uniref:heavy metal translocating P-type ATPase n=1 Tax=Ilumatobacter nonamiensis TaxID=467093 RepID=UPI0006844B1C|nr:heavy metal translocating P-type ATPase [Ilumatobacter nonamiensis]
MTETVQLDLPVLLPHVPGDDDQCVDRLTSILSKSTGISDVHVVASDGDGPSQLCLHFDSSVTSVARIRSLARASGAEITDQFAHVFWDVTGVTHTRRARSVAEHLRQMDGVAEAEVTPGFVRVEFDRRATSEQDIRDALARSGVGVKARTRRISDRVASGGLDERVPEPDTAPTHVPDDAPHGVGEDDGHDHGPGEHVHGGPFGERSELIFAITSAVLWTGGFVAELAGWFNDSILTAVFIVSGFFGGYFTLREAVDGIRNRRFEIDFLMLVAAAGAAILGKWEEGALLLALFSVGNELEGYAMGRARRAIEALADLAPATAVVRRDGTEREVPVEELVVGDTVIVKPNERIAADGFVVSGTSSVNQAPLTGESIPVDKSPVDDPSIAADDPGGVRDESRLFAGTINGTGQIDLQVTRLAKDTSLSKLATMVREAETQASPTQQFTNRFERIFVPAVLLLVVVVMVVGPAFGSSWSESFYRAMAVLVAASPCALAIATPSAVLAAVARAGQVGVLVKGGGPLESLGTLNAIAFDKTGTLTEGQPRLTDVVTADGVGEDELLDAAIAVENRSDHPLAAAIVRDGSERLGRSDVASASGVESITGRGVRAVVNGRPVLIGNLRLFEESGGLDASVRASAEQLLAEGRTIMVVKHGDRFMGTLGLRDTPRPAAKKMIDDLRALGIERAIMISGDNQLVAESIAADVGLTDAWGDLMPDDKVSAIERLRDEEGKVAMVGDGVNDAPAMANATVGIAMGAAGSDVALETADVALMGDELAKLPVIVGLSRSASRIIKQNLYMSLGMVAFLIPATLFGFVGIGPAVVFHEGSTLVVVANALRLLAYRRNETIDSERRPTETVQAVGG